jgi:hypothetical protein
MSRWIGKRLTCGKCLNQWLVYYDVQDKASRCPVCSQVQGILWDEDGSRPVPDGEHLYDRGNCEPHLKGEESYDWSWLLYDKGESNVQTG